jgi:imidazolonepropionase-like amidohydrolase
MSRRRQLALSVAGSLVGLGMIGLTAFKLGLAAPDLPVPPQRDTVIADVTIYNPGIGRQPHRTIVIRNGKIAEVRAASPDDPAPLCRDCIAMPGLIDAHVHTPPRLAFGTQELFALMYLANGITAVRDVGESEASVGDLARHLNTGQLVGPRMYRCGPVRDGDPVSWGAARKVVGAEAGKAAVAELAAAGVDCIKVYNELDASAYLAIRAEAARHAIPVIGHVPHRVGMAAIRDFEAQHFTGVPYLRGGRPALTSDFADRDFLTMGETDIARALDMAKAHNIAYLPTLANSRLRLIASDPARFKPTPGAANLPRVVTDAWNTDTIASHPTGDQIAERIARIPLTQRITRMAHERGIEILAGTDTLMPWVVPGEGLLFELDDLAEAMGNRDAALASATLINGRHIAKGAIGVIAPGAGADLLLLREDPEQDLAALRRWTILFAGGRRYDRAQVDRWLSTYRAHFHTRFYETVMGYAARYAAGDKGHAAIHDDHGD